MSINKERIIQKHLDKLNTETVLVVQVHKSFGKVIINVLEKDIPKVNTDNTFNALVDNLKQYLAISLDENCTILNIFKY